MIAAVALGEREIRALELCARCADAEVVGERRRLLEITRLRNRNTGSSVLLRLLVYQIADGAMVLSFAHMDEPGGDQAEDAASALGFSMTYRSPFKT